MPFKIVLTDRALSDLNDVATQNSAKLVKVMKTFRLMTVNIKHPSLHTHEYSAMAGEKGEKVFEAYVENKTPGAYRVFWYYGADQTLVIVAILPHP